MSFRLQSRHCAQEYLTHTKQALHVSVKVWLCFDFAFIFVLKGEKITQSWFSRERSGGWGGSEEMEEREGYDQNV